jgi:hypothetical protein
MVDSRLTKGVDDDGNPWVICQICFEKKSVQELAIDPADGLPWDVCKNCEGQTVAHPTWRT